MVVSGTMNARAISSVVRPPSRRKRQRHLRRRSERRMAAGEDQTQPIVRHDILLRRLVGRVRMGRACRSSREASRRKRSIARLRAVVMIQPAGLGGRPLDGQPSTAEVNASWTASSAIEDIAEDVNE